MDSNTTIMPTGEDIQWTVSDGIGACGEAYAVLVSDDQRIAICGTEENLSLFANSILVALAAKKVTEIAHV